MWHVGLLHSFGTCMCIALMWRVVDTCVSNLRQLLCNKTGRFSFQFCVCFLFFFLTDSEKLVDAQTDLDTSRVKERRGAAALNDNSPHESKCKCGRLGLVSPIIQEGVSKDEEALLYICVAVSDKQDLFSRNTEELCVRPYRHYSPRDNSEGTKGLGTLSGCIWRVCFCICVW